MTPDKLKELAESGAEFLGGETLSIRGSHEYIIITISPYTLFTSDYYSPILAHLAKREMEIKEYEHKSYWDGLNHEHQFMKPETNRIDEWDFSNKIAEGYHPKEYIALWLAIREAVK